jgi:hypothetical protein
VEDRNGHDCSQHSIGRSESKIIVIELGPPRGFMPARFEHRGYYWNRRPTDEVNDTIGVPFLILNVEVKLMQSCGPLLMEVIQ